MDHNQHFEQEINLSEYIDPLIKRKNLIMAVFFIAVLAAGTVNYFLPRVWGISMVLEPSSLTEISDNNPPVVKLLDTPGNIKAKIESGAFDLNVLEALKLDPKKTKLELDVSQPKESTFLKISLNMPDNDRELGVKILNQFLTVITAYYQDVVVMKKEAVDKQISITANGIKAKQDSIKLTDKNLEIVETREKELNNELKDTKANTEQLLAKRNLLLESKAPVDEISSLLYLNTIQQNMSYFNMLSNQVAENKTRKETLMNTVKTLQNDISNLGIEVEKLQLVKDSIRNISVIQEPRISPLPVGPERRQNVMIAGLVSLLGGVFLAFLLEFLEKSGYL